MITYFYYSHSYFSVLTFIVNLMIIKVVIIIMYATQGQVLARCIT